MANPLMMRYAATRGNPDHDRVRTEERRNTYDRMPIHDRMPDYGRMEMNYPMQRAVPDEYGGGAESRYRGRDGRWRAGTRRSEYSGEMTGDRPDHDRGMRNDYRRPMSGGDDDDDEDEKGRKYKIEVLPHNVVQWPGRTEPYGDHPVPSDDYRTSRQIGFGATSNMNDGSMHHTSHEIGQSSGSEPMELDRDTAEHWVRNMRNEDKAHPTGGKWSKDMLKPLAQKYGIPTDGAKFWEFYAMTNAMYSDYSEVARKFGITSPEFYACMAKAWMDDKDAYPDKTALYYECIVKKD